MKKIKIKKIIFLFCLFFLLNFLMEKCSGNKTYTGFNNFGSPLTWHDTISQIPSIAIISLVLVLAYLYVEKHMNK
jgi:hypothetical protein